MKPQAAPSNVMLSRREVEIRVGLKKGAILKRIAEGTFPAPVNLGYWNSQGWLASEVDAWVAARIAERDQQS